MYCPGSFEKVWWSVVFAVVMGMTGVAALQCFHCGQYNEGVGSITPCINDTYMQLRDCPLREINFCIKYISEGTIVRDCVPRCTEKDNWDWNSRTFCCQEDGCNAAEGLWHWHIPILLFAMPFFHLMAGSLH